MVQQGWRQPLLCPALRAPTPLLPCGPPAAWIRHQLAAGQAPTSPLTGAPLDHASLCPNRIARGLAACLLAAGVRLD